MRFYWFSLFPMPDTVDFVAKIKLSSANYDMQDSRRMMQGLDGWLRDRESVE